MISEALIKQLNYALAIAIIVTLILIIYAIKTKKTPTPSRPSLPFHFNYSLGGGGYPSYSSPRYEYPVYYPEGLKLYDLIVNPERIKKLSEILEKNGVRYHMRVEQDGIHFLIREEEELDLNPLLQAGLIRSYTITPIEEEKPKEFRIRKVPERKEKREEKEEEVMEVEEKREEEEKKEIEPKKDAIIKLIEDKVPLETIAKAFNMELKEIEAIKAEHELNKTEKVTYEVTVKFIEEIPSNIEPRQFIKNKYWMLNEPRIKVRKYDKSKNKKE